MMSIGNGTKDTSTSGYFGFVQSNREQKHKTGVIPMKNRDSQLSMLYRNIIFMVEKYTDVTGPVM